MIALRIVRSPVGAILSAIRDNPLRAPAVGHNIHGYKLTAFVIAAAYAGFAGGLLGVMQAFMPPDAFMFDTSGQLVMQTAIGGTGTLFGPLLGAAVWLFLQDFLQAALRSRRGLETGAGPRVRAAGELPAPGHHRRHRRPDRRTALAAAPQEPGEEATAADVARRAHRDRAGRSRHHAGGGRRGSDRTSRPDPAGHRPDQALSAASSPTATSISPSITASCAASSARTAPARSTFFKMLTCEVPPTSGTILFEGRDITGMSVTDVCQLGLTKSYQVNQLFTQLTVRENLTIAALAELRGKFRLDLFRPHRRASPGLAEQVEHTLQLVNLDRASDTPVSRAGLRREAPAGDWAGARDLAEPAAARRAARRHEPARAGSKPCKLLEIDRPGPHHDHHRP